MATKHETGAVKIPKRRSLERPNWAAGVLSTLWLLVVVVPLYIMVKASIEDKPHYSEEGPLSLPTMFTLDNYTNALDQGFLQAFINTAIVTVSVVAIVLIVVPPLAFAIVRSRSKFVNGVFQIMLLGIAIPVQAIIVPLFFMSRSVGLYDNLISVIVASAAFSIPMCTIVLTASMRQITNELYEAMSVDGASVVRIFFQLTLPMSKSGLATVIIYSAMGAWNNFMFPLILTQSDSNRVLTLNLYQYQSQFGIDIPGMMAAVILSVLPILVVYFIGRRSLVDGMMGMGGK